MKKEITIYELLGLIKDDKINNNTYIKYYDRKFNNEGTSYVSLNCIIDLIFCSRVILTDKVEIIEEPKELEEIEFKLNNDKGYMISNVENVNYEVFIDTKEFVLASKINEIIRYLKDKENK